MSADRDANIREYVLKKQQARERAKRMREERLQQRKETSDSRDTKSATTRIIGDPFAPSSTHVRISHSNSAPQSHAVTVDAPLRQNAKSPSTSQEIMSPSIDTSNFITRQEFDEWKSITSVLQQRMQTMQEQVRILTAENKTLRNIIVQRADSTPKSVRESDLSHDWEPTPVAQKAKRMRSASNSASPSGPASKRRRSVSSSSVTIQRADNPRAASGKKDRSRMSKQLGALKKKRRSPKVSSHDEDSPIRPDLKTSSRSSVDIRERGSDREYQSPVASPQSAQTVSEDDRPIASASNGRVIDPDEQVIGPIGQTRESDVIGGGSGYNLDDLPDAVVEDSGPREPCPDCGRKFAATAIVKHRKICKKVFGKKRKPMNMKNRLFDKDAAQAKRNATRSESSRTLKTNKAPKWKNQSSSLRDAIRAARMGADAPFVPTPAELDTRVPCPHCGRKFAEQTAERHIPKCKNTKARPTRLRRKR